MIAAGFFQSLVAVKLGAKRQIDQRTCYNNGSAFSFSLFQNGKLSDGIVPLVD